MQEDFHYYATYCASFIAGFSHEEACKIAYSANFVDCCTKTMLSKLGAPISAATTQSQLELADANTDILGLQDITRIWASFHFLPGDLRANVKFSSKRYKNKFRMICLPNSKLVIETVKLAQNESLEAIGIAMHVLADTWAHTYFAGTPSHVINNTNHYFYEIVGNKPHKIKFTHNVAKPDDIEGRKYTNSLNQNSEAGIMNLGHGRAGHLPDYSFIKYKYLPAWANYDEIVKDNPSDYMHAFCQMVYALKCLKGKNEEFKVKTYAQVKKYEKEIDGILRKRALNVNDEWKKFGEKLSGEKIPNFDVNKYEKEYMRAKNKDNTFLGRFIIASLKQKSMVTNKVYLSGNMLMGYSINYNGNSLKGLKDYWNLLTHKKAGGKK